MPRRRGRKADSLEIVARDCAGTGIGKDTHYAAVDPDRCAEPVRSFGAFTPDLEEMASLHAAPPGRPDRAAEPRDGPRYPLPDRRRDVAHHRRRSPGRQRVRGTPRRTAHRPGRCPADALTGRNPLSAGDSHPKARLRSKSLSAGVEANTKHDITRIPNLPHVETPEASELSFPGDPEESSILNSGARLDLQDFGVSLFSGAKRESRRRPHPRS